MQRLSPRGQEIWLELQEIVHQCRQPTPAYIKKHWLYIFLMPSRLWESTWFISKMAGTGKVLDVACGNSAHMIWLATNGYEYIGIDPKFAGEAGQRFQEYLAGHITTQDVLQHIMVLPTRMEELEYESEFDYVISVSAMEQIPLATVKEGIPKMMRALKPGGKMLLTVDQKLTHDGAKTYDGWYREGLPHVELKKYYEEIILATGQVPEHNWSGPGFYHDLREYLDANPNRWAMDFPEFRNEPYGLEFIKKGIRSQYDISKGYTDEIWYDKPRVEHCSWRDYQIERFSLKLINAYYNIEGVIETEVKREGQFWSQQKVNEVTSSIDVGEKLDMIQMIRRGNELEFVDGMHRAFVMERMFGIDQVIPVITRQV